MATIQKKGRFGQRWTFFTGLGTGECYILRVHGCCASFVRGSGGLSVLVSEE